MQASNALDKNAKAIERRLNRSSVLRRHRCEKVFCAGIPMGRNPDTHYVIVWVYQEESKITRDSIRAIAITIIEKVVDCRPFRNFEAVEIVVASRSPDGATIRFWRGGATTNLLGKAIDRLQWSLEFEAEDRMYGFFFREVR